MSGSYGNFQLSVKNGANLLNIAGETAVEFRTNIDDIFGEGAAVTVLAPYLATASLATPEVPTAAPVAPAPLSGPAPTEKQVAFARQLGIDPTGMTKQALSAAISAKVDN